MLRLRVVGIVVIVMSAAVLLVGVGLSALAHMSLVPLFVSFILGIPAFYLGWVTYWRDSGEPGADLGKVADDLADSVLRQWNRETQARALNDCDILPVSWEPASSDLVQSLDHLARTALAAPGDGKRAPAWARRPRQVSGSGHELAAVLQRVPTRRLVVLGEAGSGKTVLLIRLVLDLLADRAPGDPVPVLVPLASWNPSTQPLRDWVISRLTLDYPDLKSLWKSTTSRPCSLAGALLGKHILLILDGLDEIPEQYRGTALSRIGKFLALDDGVVLSCRTDEYRKALESSRVHGQVVKLHGAAGISLCPLADQDIKEYLLAGAAPRSAEARRWEPVFGVLGTDLAVAQALRTPLMAGLALVVYGPSRLDRVGDDEPRDPAELCDPVRFPHSADVKSHLFRAFVRVAYQPREDSAKNRWKTQDAERWLGFLAHHLRDRNIIAWWELRGAGPRWLVPAVVGVVCGIASGVAAALGKHVGFGIGIGLGVGAFAGLAVRIPAARLSRQQIRPSRGIAGGLVGAIAGGLIAGIAGKLGIGHAVWPFGGLAVALAIAVGVGSSTNFAGGLAGCLVGGFGSGILEGVWTGVPAGVVNGAGMGMCAALAVRYVGRPDPAYRLRWSPLGAVCGLAIGTAIGLIAGRAEGWHIGLIAGTAIGVLSAVPCGLFGLVQLESDKPQSLSPVDALSHDYRTFWMTAPAAGIAAAVAGLFGGGLASVYAVKAHPDLGTLLSNGLGIGIAAGVIIGLGFGFYHAASGSFAITRCWLALRGALPWQLMSFLVDAHAERGILRQSGTVYQFRHRELLRWLAASYEERQRR
jgi:NACHT domain